MKDYIDKKFWDELDLNTKILMSGLVYFCVFKVEGKDLKPFLMGIYDELGMEEYRTFLGEIFRLSEKQVKND